MSALWHVVFNTDFGMSISHKNAVNKYLVQTSFGFWNKSKSEVEKDNLDELQQQNIELKIHTHFLEQVINHGLDSGTSAAVHNKVDKLKQQALLSLNNQIEESSSSLPHFNCTKSELFHLLEKDGKYTLMYQTTNDDKIKNALYQARQKELEEDQAEKELRQELEQREAQHKNLMAFGNRRY